MWEWLLTPIDPDRAHMVGAAVAWHARTMVLAWGVLAPLAVLIARFYKVLPGQDWPRELDTQFWWRSHWIGQSAVLVLTILGTALIISGTLPAGRHGFLGYLVLILGAAQVAMGFFRGTKGGPTAPELRGDHYDMTRWRQVFEAAHKGLGYLLIVLSVVTIALGLWEANAPRWMWIAIGGWWAGLILAAIHLQRSGRAIDTYQAIWGPGVEHPGNALPAPGWHMRRVEDESADRVRPE
jgi:hypothetical protein